MDERDMKEKIENHEKRIGSLEVSHARLDVQIQTLVSSMNALTGTIKTAMYGAIGLGIGFIIWFIQSK